MLVLSRKQGERVIVGKHIVVTVLEIRGSRVKLGFIGPGEVLIHREEGRPAHSGISSYGARESPDFPSSTSETRMRASGATHNSATGVVTRLRAAVAGGKGGHVALGVITFRESSRDAAGFDLLLAACQRAVRQPSGPHSGMAGGAQGRGDAATKRRILQRCRDRQEVGLES